jgi:hypothetical protein
MTGASKRIGGSGERVGNRHRGTMLTKYSLPYELELVDNYT